MGIKNFIYFHVNFKFMKGNKNNEFELKEQKEEEKFNIYSNSILFCEIKTSFPNTSRGRKKYFNMKVIKPKPSENFKINNELEGLEPYCEELDKLIRKFFFFFDVYKNKNDKISNNIQIVLLYDRFSVENIDPNFIEIKDVTKNILNYYNNKFENKGNIIFQLIFFDGHKFWDDKEKKVKKQEIQLKEKDSQLQAINNQLQEKNNQIQEKDNQLQEKNNQIQEKDNQLKEKENQIKEKDNQIREKDSQIQEKDNVIQNKNEIIKNKDDELFEKENELQEKQKEVKNISDKIKELNQIKDLSAEERWNLLNEFLKNKGENT